jgi:hypothetical protein
VEVAIFVRLALAPLRRIEADLARFLSPTQWAAKRVELMGAEELAVLSLAPAAIFVQFVLAPLRRSWVGQARFVAEAARKPAPELQQAPSVQLWHDRAMAPV